MSDLTIFSVVDNKHIDFIKPFIYFADKSNPDINIEIAILDNEIPDLSYFNYKKNLLVYKNTTCKYEYEDAKVLLVPIIKTKYIYICDIEMFLMTKIEDELINADIDIVNKKLCKDRSKCKMCSRCCFVERNKYYDIINNLNNLNDDSLDSNLNTYTRIIKDNIYDFNEMSFNDTCPKPGIRIRLKRQPFNENTEKTNKLMPLYKETFINMINDESFKKLISNGFDKILEKYLNFVQK